MIRKQAEERGTGSQDEATYGIPYSMPTGIYE